MAGYGIRNGSGERFPASGRSGIRSMRQQEGADDRRLEYGSSYSWGVIPHRETGTFETRKALTRIESDGMMDVCQTIWLEQVVTNWTFRIHERMGRIGLVIISQYVRDS